MARLIGPEEEETYLKASRPGWRAIHSPHLAGRLDEGSYLIALRDNLEEQVRDDFARALLGSMLQVRLDGEKSFLMARYQYLFCEPGGAGRRTGSPG